MVMVSKFGQMVLDFMVTGKRIGPMARVSLFTLTGMFMRENGKTTKRMVWVFMTT